MSHQFYQQDHYAYQQAVDRKQQLTGNLHHCQEGEYPITNVINDSFYSNSPDTSGTASVYHYVTTDQHQHDDSGISNDTQQQPHTPTAYYNAHYNSQLLTQNVVAGAQANTYYHPSQPPPPPHHTAVTGYHQRLHQQQQHLTPLGSGSYQQYQDAGYQVAQPNQWSNTQVTTQSPPIMSPFINEHYDYDISVNKDSGINVKGSSNNKAKKPMIQRTKLQKKNGIINNNINGTPTVIRSNKKVMHKKHEIQSTEPNKATFQDEEDKICGKSLTCSILETALKHGLKQTYAEDCVNTPPSSEAPASHAIPSYKEVTSVVEDNVCKILGKNSISQVHNPVFTAMKCFLESDDESNHCSSPTINTSGECVDLESLLMKINCHTAAYYGKLVMKAYNGKVKQNSAAVNDKCRVLLRDMGRSSDQITGEERNIGVGEFVRFYYGDNMSHNDDNIYRVASGADRLQVYERCGDADRVAYVGSEEHIPVAGDGNEYRRVSVNCLYRDYAGDTYNIVRLNQHGNLPHKDSLLRQSESVRKSFLVYLSCLTTQSIDADFLTILHKGPDFRDRAHFQQELLNICAMISDRVRDLHHYIVVPPAINRCLQMRPDLHVDHAGRSHTGGHAMCQVCGKRAESSVLVLAGRPYNSITYKPVQPVMEDGQQQFQEERFGACGRCSWFMKTLHGLIHFTYRVRGLCDSQVEAYVKGVEANRIGATAFLEPSKAVGDIVESHWSTQMYEEFIRALCME